MNNSKCLLLAFVSIIPFSCHRDEVKPSEAEAVPDYIVFGHYFGFCQGEQCIEIFKLTSTNLYEDSNDQYPNIAHPYAGNYHLLTKTQFEKVKALGTKIPSQLLATTSTVIGAPDVTDGGGIYFEISTQGKSQFWLIDKMENNIPEYLRPFVEEVEADVQLINN